MEKFKKEDGVTITTLIVGLVILMMVIGMLTYGSTNSVSASNLLEMNNDVALLSSKVSQYFVENGEIPVLAKYDVGTLFERSGDEQKVLGANDGDVFYIIDLVKLSGVTLNYGKEYTQIKEYIESIGELEPEQSEITVFEDVYVINEKSHNVYYVKGIYVGDNLPYHTDDLSPDEVEVELIDY